MKSLSDIEKLHAVYNQFTGFDLSMRYDRERSWYEYIRAGFTAEDLRLVIIHLKRGIRRKERHSGCLKFSNIVEPLQHFEEELALARAFNRTNQPRTERQSVIEVFRPRASESSLQIKCRPVGEIIPKLIQQMRKAASE